MNTFSVIAFIVASSSVCNAQMLFVPVFEMEDMPSPQIKSSTEYPTGTFHSPKSRRVVSLSLSFSNKSYDANNQ